MTRECTRQHDRAMDAAMFERQFRWTLSPASGQMWECRKNHDSKLHSKFRVIHTVMILLQKDTRAKGTEKAEFKNKIYTLGAKMIRALVFSAAKNGFKSVISIVCCSVSVGNICLHFQTLILSLIVIIQ